MPAATYPLPPTEPPGGWKNDAQWIGNVEEWAREMMRIGYTPDDLAKVYQQHIGEKFPKNLMNSIRANNWLFPGADMMYEYDLDNHMKRHYTYNDPAIPGAKKGPFEWEPMHPDEIAAVNQYYGWRNDPAHEWMIKATIDSSGGEGNPYAAWLRQWGDYYKRADYQVPKTPGKATAAHDIFNRPGYDASGRPINDGTTPTPGITPTAPNTPGRPGPGERGPKTASTDAGTKESNYARLTDLGGTSSVGTAKGMGLIGRDAKLASAPTFDSDKGWNASLGGPPVKRRFIYK